MMGAELARNDEREARSKRAVIVEMPRELVVAVDAAAAASFTSRSSFVRQACAEKLTRCEGPQEVDRSRTG